MILESEVNFEGTAQEMLTMMVNKVRDEVQPLVWKAIIGLEKRKSIEVQFTQKATYAKEKCTMKVLLRYSGYHFFEPHDLRKMVKKGHIDPANVITTTARIDFLSDSESVMEAVLTRAIQSIEKQFKQKFSWTDVYLYHYLKSDYYISCTHFRIKREDV